MADDDAARPKPGRPALDGGPGNGADESAPRVADGDQAQVPAGEVRATREERGPSEVERLRVELEAAQDRFLRERAELDNFKKRVARERADTMRFASEGLLRDLLPVVDNLERALEHARVSRHDDPIIEGIELVLRSFTETLERHGVRAVEARGVPFDPSRHEAIGHVESERPPNTVVDEHRRGYLLHERLLRPSQVTVGKGPAETALDVEKADDDG